MYLLSSLFKKTLISLGVLSSLASSQSFAKNWQADIKIHFDANITKADQALFRVEKSITDHAVGKLKHKNYGEIDTKLITVQYKNENIHITVNGDFDNTDKAANQDFLDRLVPLLKNKKAFEKASHIYNTISNGSAGHDPCYKCGTKYYESGNIEGSQLNFVIPIQIFPFELSSNPINILIGKGHNSKEDDWYFGLLKSIDTSNPNSFYGEILRNKGHDNQINNRNYYNANMYFMYSYTLPNGTRKNLGFVLESATHKSNKFDLWVKSM